MATSRRVMLLVVACTLMVLSIGSAEAIRCRNWYRNCDHDDHNGCETYVWNDVHNCGYCGHECHPTWGEHAESYCHRAHCKQRCTHGYHYDRHQGVCVEDRHH